MQTQKISDDSAQELINSITLNEDITPSVERHEQSPVESDLNSILH